MSAAFNKARVYMLLADFAVNDAVGKLNVIGGGISMMPLLPHGATPNFALIVYIEHPVAMAGTQYSTSIDLWDDDRGVHAQAPGPSGQLEVIRFQQVIAVPAPPPQQVGFKSAHDTYSRHSMVLAFAAGIPLVEGTTYDWKVQIDGKSKDHWTYRMHVLEQDTTGGLVYGGQPGPPTIPGVAPDIVAQDDDADEAGKQPGPT